MKVISIASNKGGVGKTSTAISIATALAQMGYKVLGLDFDGQGHFTKGLGIKHADVDYTVAQWLMERKPFATVAKESNGITLLPSTKELNYEVEILQKHGSFPNTLRKMFEKLPSRFDFAIIDCPPEVGTMQKLAFVGSHYFLVPFQPEFFSHEGLGDIITFANDVKSVNKNLKFAGVFAWQFNPKQKSNFKQRIVTEVKEQLGSRFFDTYIRSNTIISEAQSHGKNIYEYAPKSNCAKDYYALTKELLEKVK